MARLKDEGSLPLETTYALNLATACALLNIPVDQRDVSDDTIQVNLIGLLDESTPAKRRLELGQALQTVGEARRSEVLRNIASDAIKKAREDLSNKSAVIDSMAPRGISNIGNTCYLNSLLQYLYTIKPVRELVQSHSVDEDHAMDGTSENTDAVVKRDLDVQSVRDRKC